MMKRAPSMGAAGIALPAEDAENDENVLHRLKRGSAAARNGNGGALCDVAGDGSFSSLLSGAVDGQPGVANQMQEHGATKQHHSQRGSR
jgi:hypothetical protein